MFLLLYLKVAAKSLQSCPTLCDPIDGSPPGSPVPGIFQARTLEWVAISFSNAWKGKVKVKSLSRVRLSATPWTAAHQAPLSMGFSRQEYWSGVPLAKYNNKKFDLYTSPYLAIFSEICLYFPIFKKTFYKFMWFREGNPLLCDSLERWARGHGKYKIEGIYVC